MRRRLFFPEIPAGEYRRPGHRHSVCPGCRTNCLRRWPFKRPFLREAGFYDNRKRIRESGKETAVSSGQANPCHKHGKKKAALAAQVAQTLLSVPGRSHLRIAPRSAARSFRSLRASKQLRQGKLHCSLPAFSASRASISDAYRAFVTKPTCRTAIRPLRSISIVTGIASTWYCRPNSSGPVTIV